MKQSVIRDFNGRVLGRLDKSFQYSDDDFYKDHKCTNVIFPQHTGKMHGDVVTYNISQLNNK